MKSWLIFIRLSNQEEGEAEVVKKVLEAFEQHKADGYNVDMEYARFCLDHNINLTESLKSAKREFDRRPDNIDVLETYTWALYKNHKTEEAVPFLQKALRFNTQRVSLFYHAGIVFKEVNRNEEALKYFEKIFKTDAFINPLYVENAKRSL